MSSERAGAYGSTKTPEAPKLYTVTAGVTVITEEPAPAYPRTDEAIPYFEGVVMPLAYGSMVLASPLTEGEFAGRLAKVTPLEQTEDVFPANLSGGADWAGESDPSGSVDGYGGYVDMKDIAPVPETAFFPDFELCRFTADSPELFILPGSFPVANYAAAGQRPYRVLAGEAADGAGTFTDGAGREWTLLRFGSPGSSAGCRYAWTRSENVTRLSRYEPDNTKIDPALVPRRLRGSGPVEERFYQALLRDGFALDAAPLIRERIFLDDLVESYPDSAMTAVAAPNFITADLLLHAFHIVLSRSAQDIEDSSLVPALEIMLPAALAKLDELELELELEQNASADLPFARARDFLSVPAFLMDPESVPHPSERASLEIVRVLDAEGMEESGISGRTEDYSLCRPRGHYAASESLSRYFRAMAYLRGVSFPADTGDAERDRENAAMTELLRAVFSGELRSLRDSVYAAAACLAGAPDALELYLNDRDSGQFFWNSPMWEAKKLLTASASRAEIKHGAAPYAERAKNFYARFEPDGIDMGGIDMGGMDMSRQEYRAMPFAPPVPLGYVEPSPRTFAAAAAVLERLLKALDGLAGEGAGDAWNTNTRSRVEALLAHVTYFAGIAEKEVKGEPLSREDYMEISRITSYLNSELLLGAEIHDGEDGENSGPLEMAAVSCVSSDAGGVLYAGTGTPRRLYVFVDDKWGGPRVTVGYTYSFYEFSRGLPEEPVTAEEWRELVYDKARQAELENFSPAWSKDLFRLRPEP